MTDDASRRARAPRRRVPGEIPWDEIRQIFEDTDIVVSAIAATYGVREAELYNHARRNNWVLRRDRDPGPRRMRRVNREMLVGRMLQAVERQIAEIDRRFDPEAGEVPAPDERDARTLATLARTLEMLIGLDKGAAATRKADEPKGNLDDLRRELARRIEGLRER